ncbi:MAG: polysaccharide deacetylase family protein [Clostridia bacterium]|jgi:polysaccharide deacetylase family sporulation protein PdaB|nr:polysaccharide deacetylase family protein [Clostridia bacterium]
MKRIFSLRRYFLGIFILTLTTTILTTDLDCKPNERFQLAETSGAKRLLPIYCVNTNGEKLVSITFDAAWAADDTDQLIATLKKYNVKATFFVVGDWVRKYPEAVKKFSDEGHDIANHSDRHPHVNNMNKEQIKKDIMAAHQTIKDLLGKETNLYRPPYGEYNNTVIEAAKECNYHVIQWDVDSLDWKEYGLQPLIDRVLNHKNLRPGSIILLHNSSKYTAKALDTIIKGLLEKGYRIVPISELIIKDEAYKIDFEGRQHKLNP